MVYQGLKLFGHLVTARRRRTNSFPGQLANEKRPQHREPPPSQRRCVGSDIYMSSTNR